VCKKKATTEVNWELVAQEETITVNEHFTKEKPLITEEIESEVRSKFATALDLVKAHHVLFKSKLFSHEDLLGYDFALFLEDIKGFSLATPGMMTGDEAISFLKAMQ
jgi:hypothetical protein